MFPIHLLNLPLKVLLKHLVDLARVGLKIRQLLFILDDFLQFGFALLLQLPRDLELLIIMLINKVLDFLFFLHQSFVSTVLCV